MLSVAPAEIPATALVEEGGTSKDSTHHSNISTTGNVAGTPLTRICPLLVSHGSSTSAQRRPKKKKEKTTTVMYVLQTGNCVEGGGRSDENVQ